MYDEADARTEKLGNEMSKIWSIYIITNIVNGKQYVGQTCQDNPHVRWERHLDTSCLDFHSLSALQKAIMKYGEENFQFEVIDQAYDEYAADQLEKAYVSIYGTEYPNGYNLTAGGAGCLAITSPCDEDDDEPEFDEKEELYGNLLHDEFCGEDQSQSNRKTPDWVYDDEKIKLLLLSVFPKLYENESHRRRAGTWARAIYLYHRVGLTANRVAFEMGVKEESIKTLLYNRLPCAAKGESLDGRGRKKKRGVNLVGKATRTSLGALNEQGS